MLAEYFKLNLPEIEIMVEPEEDKWLAEIERASILVSGGFHHTIAAICLGTKFIALNSSNMLKVTGMLEAVGINSKVLNFTDLNLRKLLFEAKREVELPPKDKRAQDSVKI